MTGYFKRLSFENILLSSSTQVESLDPSSFLRLPVEPSEGNYYEAGLTKVFHQKVKLDTNYYRRLVSNYADDDQIQNTAISFPISFRRSAIHGAEAKLDLPDVQGFSGFLSYSYMVGNAWFPVTGGLFLGDDTQGLPSGAHFPVSQDQRNTVRGRLRYQVKPRFSVAAAFSTTLACPSSSLAMLRPRSCSMGSKCSTASILPGGGSILVSSERLCRGGRLSVGTVERPTSGGRSEPHECPQCDRLWRTFLGKCHRTVTELLAPAHVDILGKAAVSAHHPRRIWSSVGDKSLFHSLTGGSGEQTAQTGVNAWFRQLAGTCA